MTAVEAPAPTRTRVPRAGQPRVAWTHPRLEIAAHGAVVLLAFALRLYQLDAPSLRGDEAFGFFFARQPLLDMFRAMIATEPHPPLFYLLFGGWMQVAGISEFSLRFFSVAFGVVSVPLTAALGRRLFGRPAGLIAALLLGVAPLQIWNSQDARMFTLAVAITLATTVLLADLIRLAGETGRFAARRGAAFAALSLIGLFSLYHTAFVLIFHCLVAFLWLRRPRRVALGWLAVLAAIVAVYVPWLILARRALFGHGGNGISPGLWGGIQNAFESLTIGETVSPEVAGPLALWLAAWLAVAVWAAARRWPAGTLFAALYVLVPTLVVLALALVRPVYQPRYVIPAQPGLALLAGAGLVALADWGHQLGRRPVRTVARFLALAGLALFLGGSAHALSNYWFDARFVKASGWRDATDYIRAHWQPGDFAILTVPDPSFGYYFRDEANSAVLPAQAPVDPIATGRSLVDLAERHPRIWLIPFRSPTWDADGFVEDWLERNAQPADRQEFQNVRVRLYTTERPERDADPCGGVAFADGITLEAFQLTPAPNRPAELRLTLFWRARDRPSRDYTVFTHLLAPDGRLAAQQDNPPRQGTYPTSRWLPGELIADDYAIALDPAVPPGRYRLEVGLYASESGQRLLTAAGADAVVLTERTLP